MSGQWKKSSKSQKKEEGKGIQRKKGKTLEIPHKSFMTNFPKFNRGGGREKGRYFSFCRFEGLTKDFRGYLNVGARMLTTTQRKRAAKVRLREEKE